MDTVFANFEGADPAVKQRERGKAFEPVVPGQNANVVSLGNVGVGKSHLATALSYAACLEGHAVLFAGALEVINDLQAAQKNGGLERNIFGQPS